ncbi:MAG: SDR family oxidoreductase [Crocinitomicaceae bacterium]|nr:SDR family oxidoreductase [Crocinitomicaceae bacterium]
MNPKNIVVVGASRGIGREISIQLSESHNVLAISRNIEKLRALENTETNHPINIAAADVTVPNYGEVLENILSQYFSSVDVLINCAGYLVNKPLTETSDAEMLAVFQTNVLGLMASCKAVIPAMKDGGHIVNIGSMGGFQGSVKFPGLSVYSASKSAVAGFSECLAAETADLNIQVNCLAIGAAQTEMLEEAFPGYKAPLSAGEMANFIGDFALNANKYINGKTIPVSVSTP